MPRRAAPTSSRTRSKRSSRSPKFAGVRSKRCCASFSPRCRITRVEEVLTMNEAVPSVSRLLDLSGRTAIITGASGGIGAGIARRFGEAAANVVCHYHANQAAAEAVAARIVAGGGKAVAASADVSIKADAVALIDHAVERFGSADIL